MFYGASTIEPDGRSAVGRLGDTCKKYVQAYGPGAIVFMQGFGERVAETLSDLGVTALNCSSPTTVALEPVYTHMRTWCADDEGNILY